MSFQIQSYLVIHRFNFHQFSIFKKWNLLSRNYHWVSNHFVAILQALFSPIIIIVSAPVEALDVKPVEVALPEPFYDTCNELHADLAKILI